MDGFVNSLSYVANYIMRVDMFPVFFLADFSISTILVRNDSDHLGPKFRQKHPFASWFCTLLTCLSGAFIASFLFGDPLLDILKENVLILYVTIIWYLLNYAPFDIVYKVVMKPFILVPFCVLQEFARIRFVYLGVQTAAQLYPTAPLIIMMGGIIKGNGYGFIKVVERLFRGLWNPKTNEILEVTYFAKSGVIASVLFLLHHYKVLAFQVEFLYLAVLVGFIVGRLVLMLGGVDDPLSVVEAPMCRLLFGCWKEGKSNKVDVWGSNNKTELDVNKNNNKKKSGNTKKNGGKKKD